jgi:acetylglutamate kinase
VVLLWDISGKDGSLLYAVKKYADDGTDIGQVGRCNKGRDKDYTGSL